MSVAIRRVDGTVSHTVEADGSPHLALRHLHDKLRRNIRENLLEFRQQADRRVGRQVHGSALR
ncbi:MAG: hypothetical protein LC121_24405 [Anaerolineae bacterium]|nr:hypothetical protein [Anaerolineae bacterium]